MKRKHVKLGIETPTGHFTNTAFDQLRPDFQCADECNALDAPDFIVGGGWMSWNSDLLANVYTQPVGCIRGLA